MALPPPTSAPRSPALFFGRQEKLRRHVSEMPPVRLSVVYGAGGVGKTSFVLRASEELAERVGARRAWVRCRPGESAATLAAAALACIAPTSPGHPVEGLLDAGPLVLVIDDAHLADPAVVTELCEYLVNRSAAIHVCITSRSALPFSPVAIDHLVTKLTGLDAAATTQLWAALESLYGAAAVAPGRLAGGNPLLIKRAFADTEPGTGPGVDSLGLGELDPLARELLVELCALRAPAPRAALAAGRDGEAVDLALRALERRFLVEPVGDGFGVHDVIREGVEGSPWRPGPAAHARWIARFRDDAAGNEASLRALHHAVAAGEDRLAVDLLRAEAAQARRIPPGSTLLDRELREAIDELERRTELPVELRQLRARVRAKQGEVRAAFEELESLPGADPQLECDRADVAHMLGLVQRSRDAALRVLADHGASPIAHARALVVAIDATRTAGDMPRALELADLDTPPLRLLGPLRDGLRAWLRAVTLFDCERYRDASDEVARARSVLVPSFPSAIPMLSSLERTIAALVGTTAASEDDAGDHFEENALFRCLARLLRAQEILARGGARPAAELAQQVWALGEQLELLPVVSWASWIWAQAACALGDHAAVIERAPPLLDALERAGHVPPRVRLMLALAEAQLAAGQPEAALALARRAHDLTEHFPRSRAMAEALAARAGADPDARAPTPGDDLSGFGAEEAWLASAELALERGDLAAASAAATRVESAATRFGWLELACRAGLVRAEHAFRVGDLAAARDRLERHAALAVELGHRAAQGHAEALAAAVARAEARVLPEAGSPLRDARASARLHLHEPIAVELASDAGRSLLARAQLDEVDLSAAEWVVDRERGTVRRGQQVVDLSRRTTLLDLLAALASPPGAWLTPAELAERAWQLDYHPIKHHSRLAMAVARLREVLGADTIEGGRAGYRLAEAARWVVIHPVRPARDP